MVLHSFTICILLKQITKVHCIIKKKEDEICWIGKFSVQKHCKNISVFLQYRIRIQITAGTAALIMKVGGQVTVTQTLILSLFFSHIITRPGWERACVCVCAAELKLLTRLKPVMAVCRTHRFKIKKRFNNSYRCNNFCTEAAWQINCILSAASRALSC